MRFWVTVVGLIAVFSLLLAIIVVAIGGGRLHDIPPAWSVIFGGYLIFGGFVELTTRIERRLVCVEVAA